jgi:hypothetical protein
MVSRSWIGCRSVAKTGRDFILEQDLLYVDIEVSKHCEFRCSSMVGMEVLPVARPEQRPQIGRATLLSAPVKAYKPRHCGGRMKIRPPVFCGLRNCTPCPAPSGKAAQAMTSQFSIFACLHSGTHLYSSLSC